MYFPCPYIHEFRKCTCLYGCPHMHFNLKKLQANKACLECKDEDLKICIINQEGRHLCVHTYGLQR